MEPIFFRNSEQTTVYYVFICYGQCFHTLAVPIALWYDDDDYDDDDNNDNNNNIIK